MDLNVIIINLLIASLWPKNDELSFTYIEAEFALSKAIIDAR